MSGTLTWEEFLQDCNEFIAISQKIDIGNWRLGQTDCAEGHAYLVCNNKIRISQPQDEHNPVDLINIEYNVVYSISYQVPVLYFRGYKSTGVPLSLEESWEIFKEQALDKQDLLKTLTQTEHPVNFKPYLVLHPCRTSEILSNTPNSKNRIVTFLSTVGPYIKLNLDEQIGVHFNKDEIKN